MTLAFIGIGLATEKDISVKGLGLCKEADKIYLESYTNLLQCPIQRLEALYGKTIITADRKLVEQQAEQTILKDALDQNVCFLVIGDVFSATTHTDLYLRAVELGIEVVVAHNASIFSVIGQTGLQVYKFGKVTSIPFSHDQVSTPYQYLEQNRSIGAHTLFLLDLDPIEGKYLSINEAVDYLHAQEKKHGKNLIAADEKFVACARLGSAHPLIAYGTAEQLAKIDFGGAPYCLVLPGKLHFLEEEFLEQFKL